MNYPQGYARLILLLSRPWRPLYHRRRTRLAPHPPRL